MIFFLLTTHFSRIKNSTATLLHNATKYKVGEKKNGSHRKKNGTFCSIGVLFFCFTAEKESHRMDMMIASTVALQWMNQLLILRFASHWNQEWNVTVYTWNGSWIFRIHSIELIHTNSNCGIETRFSIERFFFLLFHIITKFSTKSSNKLYRQFWFTHNTKTWTEQLINARALQRIETIRIKRHWLCDIYKMLVVAVTPLFFPRRQCD